MMSAKNTTESIHRPMYMPTTCALDVDRRGGRVGLSRTCGASRIRGKRQGTLADMGWPLSAGGRLTDHSKGRGVELPVALARGEPPAQSGRAVIGHVCSLAARRVMDGGLFEPRSFGPASSVLRGVSKHVDIVVVVIGTALDRIGLKKE